MAGGPPVTAGTSSSMNVSPVGPVPQREQRQMQPAFHHPRLELSGPVPARPEPGHDRVDVSAVDGDVGGLVGEFLEHAQVTRW